MKGVRCRNDYWYARIDSQEKYCGKGEKGRKVAEAARKKWEVRQYENKEINAGLKVKKVMLKTVLDLSNWYMLEIPSVQESKSYERKVYISKNLLDFFRDRPLNRIESGEQEAYREYRKTQGAMDGTIDLELRLLRAMYLKAVTAKMIPRDFLPGEFLQAKKVNPRRIVMDDEFEKLVKHAANSDFRDFLICGYESAMRNSEICNLTVEQIHLDMKHFSGTVLDYIDLGIFDSKNKTRRTIPISPNLKEVLQRRIKDLDPEDHVFTENGKKYNRHTIGKRMGTSCKAASVPYGDKTLNKKGERVGIVFHSLRHTRTTKWVEMGFSDEIIRRATGHKSLEAYQRYVRLDPAAVMRLVENTKHGKNEAKPLQNLNS
jgi:integrase